jgi:enoyl-CoA hydratase/carnithine racemase
LTAGQVRIERQGALALVTLSHPGKRNAMSRAMWRALRAGFEAIQAEPGCRCVVLRGADGQFCAGGDIAEYPGFRFDAAALRDFHEDDVWGGLRAMLECDVPVLAQIEGACMGGGMEIACCCDIRIAGAGASFGAPIARLGFPMAPREAQLVAAVAGEATLREMLLEAVALDAAEMKARGFLQRVVPDADVARQALHSAERIAQLAPQAARLNKQALRQLRPLPAPLLATAYDYAPSAEHREGVAAFLAKRQPTFRDE